MRHTDRHASEGGIMVRRLPSQVMLFAALFVMCAGSAGTIADRRDVQWRMIGQDPENSRNQPNEHRIRPENARRLALKWVATTAGDISATPAGGDGAGYAGGFGGMLWKLDPVTGQGVWARRVSAHPGPAGEGRRPSPSVAGTTLIA